MCVIRWTPRRVEHNGNYHTTLISFARRAAALFARQTVNDDAAVVMTLQFPPMKASPWRPNLIRPISTPSTAAVDDDGINIEETSLEETSHART
jgi:hypothetical protein